VAAAALKQQVDQTANFYVTNPSVRKQAISLGLRFVAILRVRAAQSAKRLASLVRTRSFVTTVAKSLVKTVTAHASVLEVLATVDTKKEDMKVLTVRYLLFVPQELVPGLVRMGALRKVEPGIVVVSVLQVKVAGKDPIARHLPSASLGRMESHASTAVQ